MLPLTLYCNCPCNYYENIEKKKLFSVSIWCMKVVITFVDGSLCALLSRHSSRANNP